MALSSVEFLSLRDRSFRALPRLSEARFGLALVPRGGAILAVGGAGTKVNKEENAISNKITQLA